MAENNAVALPEGFVLDKKKETMPEGFVLDTPQTDTTLPEGFVADSTQQITPAQIPITTQGTAFPQKKPSMFERVQQKMGAIKEAIPEAVDRMAAFTAPLKAVPGFAGIANIAQTGSEVFGTPKEVSAGMASAAAFASGTIGMSESIYRTPDALLRFTRFAHKKFAPEGVKFEGSGQQEMMSWVAKHSTQLAESIKSAREMLSGPVLADTALGKPFVEVSKINQKADVATNKLFEGDVKPLLDLLGDTKTWGAFVGQAAPSMIAAIMSGGSLKFISWLEGMEFASDTADFEKRTGQRISDEEFVKGLGQVAFINGLLERLGIRKITKGAGREAVRKFLNSSIGKKAWMTVANGLTKGLWEGTTEALQQVNTNIAEFIRVQGKKLTELTPEVLSRGVLASTIGGFGAGVGVSTATQAAQIKGTEPKATIDAKQKPAKKKAPTKTEALPAEKTIKKKAKAEANIVYHGGAQTIDTFDLGKVKKWNKFGHFFTREKGFAENFGDVVTEAQVDIKKPKVITQDQWWDIRGEHAKDDAWFESWKNKLKAQGFDGLLVKSRETDFAGQKVTDPEIIVAFDDSQVKTRTQIQAEERTTTKRTTPTTDIQEENIDPKTIQEARKIVDDELKGVEGETKTGTGTFYSGIPVEAVHVAANKALDNLQDNLGIPIEGVVVSKGEEFQGVGPGPNILRSPNRVSEKFPVFKKYFEWSRIAFNVQERIRSLFNKRENAIDKLLGGTLIQRKTPILNKRFKDNWQQFESLSWAADLIGRDFTDAELKADNVPKEVILALKLQRNAFDNARKLSNKIRDIRGKTEVHRRGGYIPHFFHNFFLVGKDGVITSARTLKEAVKLANQAARIGEKVTITQKMFSFPGEEVQAAVMGDMSFFKLKNSVEKSFELTAEEATEVLEGIARMKGRSRFIGNFLQRKGVKGFEKDLRWVKRHYFNMIARYVAMDRFKQQSITAFNREGFGDFDKQQKGIASHIKNYINDTLGVPTRVEDVLNHFLNETPIIRNITGKFLGGRPALQIASTITSAVSIVKLGLGNISAAVINMSQYNLKQSVLGPKYNFVGDWRAAKVIKELAKRKLLTKGTFIVPSDIAFDLGVLRASNVFTQLGLEAGAGYSSAGLLGPMFRSSMVLFQSVEVYLRISTTLGAYHKAITEIAKREGITKNEVKKNKAFHKEALKVAEETNFFVNFDYSIVDAPSILRRTGPVGQVQFQFKKFPIKMTESIINMKAAQHARFWIPLFLLAGLYAIPGWDLLKDILKKLSKLWGEEFDMELELKTALTNWAGKDKGKRAIAKTIMYGAFSNKELGGISIGRRVGVGDFIPTDVEDATLGPFFSSAIRAIQMGAQREWIETLRAIATAPGNIAKAIANEGEMVSPWDRNRLVTKLDTKGRIFKAMGFRTAAEAMESDQARIVNYQIRKLKKMRAKAVDLIVEAAIAQDKGDTKKSATLETRAIKLIEKHDILFTNKMIENEVMAKNLSRGQRAAFRAMKNNILLGRISGSLEFFESEREDMGKR